jgi:hypothetical protein
MDVCDPGAKTKNIRKLIKLHTGKTIKISRDRICDIMKDVDRGNLPLPPLVLTRDKRYLLDPKSPLTRKDFENLFKSNVTSKVVKRLARKVGLIETDKTISDLKRAIGRKLASMNVREPILLPGSRVYSKIKSEEFENEGTPIQTNENENQNRNQNREENRNRNQNREENRNRNRGREENRNRGREENRNRGREENRNRGREENRNRIVNANSSSRSLQNMLKRRRHMDRLKRMTGSGISSVLNGSNRRNMNSKLQMEKIKLDANRRLQEQKRNFNRRVSEKQAIEERRKRREARIIEAMVQNGRREQINADNRARKAEAARNREYENKKRAQLKANTNSQRVKRLEKNYENLRNKTRRTLNRYNLNRKRAFTQLSESQTKMRTLGNKLRKELDRANLERSLGAKIRADLDVAKLKIEKSEQRIKEIEKERTTLNTTISNLQSRLDMKTKNGNEDEVDRLTKELEEAKTKIEELTKEVTTLTNNTKQVVADATKELNEKLAQAVIASNANKKKVALSEAKYKAARSEMNSKNAALKKAAANKAAAEKAAAEKAAAEKAAANKAAANKAAKAKEMIETALRAKAQKAREAVQKAKNEKLASNRRLIQDKMATIAKMRKILATYKGTNPFRRSTVESQGEILIQKFQKGELKQIEPAIIKLVSDMKKKNADGAAAKLVNSQTARAAEQFDMRKKKEAENKEKARLARIETQKREGKKVAADRALAQFKANAKRSKNDMANKKAINAMKAVSNKEKANKAAAEKATAEKAAANKAAAEKAAANKAAAEKAAAEKAAANKAAAEKAAANKAAANKAAANKAAAEKAAANKAAANKAAKAKEMIETALRAKAQKAREAVQKAKNEKLASNRQLVQDKMAMVAKMRKILATYKGTDPIRKASIATKGGDLMRKIQKGELKMVDVEKKAAEIVRDMKTKNVENATKQLITNQKTKAAEQFATRKKNLAKRLTAAASKNKVDAVERKRIENAKRRAITARIKHAANKQKVINPVNIKLVRNNPLFNMKLKRNVQFEKALAQKGKMRTNPLALNADIKKNHAIPVRPSYKNILQKQNPGTGVIRPARMAGSSERIVQRRRVENMNMGPERVQAARRLASNISRNAARERIRAVKRRGGSFF